MHYYCPITSGYSIGCFQFLGIPPKGEPAFRFVVDLTEQIGFPISRDPPEGGTEEGYADVVVQYVFPISRDPPEGGTKTAIFTLNG